MQMHTEGKINPKLLLPPVKLSAVLADPKDDDGRSFSGSLVTEDAGVSLLLLFDAA